MTPSNAAIFWCRSGESSSPHPPRKLHSGPCSREQKQDSRVGGGRGGGGNSEASVSAPNPCDMFFMLLIHFSVGLTVTKRFLSSKLFSKATLWEGVPQVSGGFHYSLPPSLHVPPHPDSGHLFGERCYSNINFKFPLRLVLILYQDKYVLLLLLYLRDIRTSQMSLKNTHTSPTHTLLNPECKWEGAAAGREPPAFHPHTRRC